VNREKHLCLILFQGAGPNVFATDEWTRWINMKAAMKFAGEPERGGDTYPWENFTAKEIETYLSFYDTGPKSKSTTKL